MVGHCIKNLTELKDFLKGLTEEQYNRKSESLHNSSIGEHLRHILECYQCLLIGSTNKEVNYDDRRRDLKLETELYFALNTIDEIINSLLEVKEDFPVSFKVNYSTNKSTEPMLVESSFFRELAYNLEHSVHHQALIKIAINEMHLHKLISSTFGYAPSTIRHLNN